MEYNHTLLITLIIKDVGLNFDVLAQHIEAKLFHFGNVIAITLGRCGSVDAVAVIALVEKPVEEIGLAVEANIRLACNRLNINGTQCKIGIDFILAVADGKGVKMRIFGRPMNGVFDCDFNFVTLVAVNLIAFG